jgi:hypothetical protein
MVPKTGSRQIARRLIIVHDQDFVHPHLDLKQLAPPTGNICPWSATPREFLWWSRMRPVFYPLDAFASATTCVTV